MSKRRNGLSGAVASIAVMVMLVIAGITLVDLSTNNQGDMIQSQQSQIQSQQSLIQSQQSQIQSLQKQVQAISNSTLAATVTMTDVANLQREVQTLNSSLFRDAYRRRSPRDQGYPPDLELGHNSAGPLLRRPDRG